MFASVLKKYSGNENYDFKQPIRENIYAINQNNVNKIS